MSGSILFVNRFYWPDLAATGQMLTDLAEDMAAAGWQVNVLTGRQSYSIDQRLLPQEETVRGVRIIRVNNRSLRSQGMLGKLASFATFLVWSWLRLLRLPKVDVIVAMTDPPFLLLPALSAAGIRGSRVVYWAQDVYPHLAAQLHVINQNGLLYRALARLMRELHRRCDAVVALGPQMQRKIIEAGAVAERTTVIHNWVDTRAVRPIPREGNSFVRDQELSGKFVVLYSGNAGRAHCFEAVIEAMRQLREDQDTVFVWIGGGRRLADIHAAVDGEGLPNARFVGYVPREQLSHSLSAASVSLVTECPEAAGFLVPSKTYGIMASGRPLIFVGSGQSDVAAVISEAECGFVVSPDNAQGLVDAIRYLKCRPDEARRMGERGRIAAERHYDRSVSTQRWSNTVSELLEALP